MTRGTPRRNRRGTAEAGRREKREGGMKSREDEGIEDRWKRRAELSAESPGRKTRHHRKIALSRTHLFSIPSSWPFAPALGTTLCSPLHFSPATYRASRFSLLRMHQPRFFHPTAYIQIRFVGFLCSAWVTGPNSPVPRYARSLARFSVKRAIPRPTKLPHFFRQTEEAAGE